MKQSSVEHQMEIDEYERKQEAAEREDAKWPDVHTATADEIITAAANLAAERHGTDSIGAQWGYEVGVLQSYIVKLCVYRDIVEERLRVWDIEASKDD